MTQKEALKELKKLDGGDPFGEAPGIRSHGKHTVTLDGWFTKEELEIIIQAMK